MKIIPPFGIRKIRILLIFIIVCAMRTTAVAGNILFYTKCIHSCLLKKEINLVVVSDVDAVFDESIEIVCAEEDTNVLEKIETIEMTEEEVIIENE